jgi:hypothetical protein
VRASVRASVRDSVEFTSFTSYGNISDYGWVAFYDFFQSIGHPIGEAEVKFNAFKNLLLSHHYDMCVFEKLVIVCEKPLYIHKNEDGRMHNLNGPAIEWEDGYKLYYVNGRNLPEWIWEQKDTITKEQFINEKNSEIRAGIYAVVGQKRMMEILGAECVDTSHANNEILRLWKTKETFPEADDNVLAWVQCQCPSTLTEYFLGCEPEHTSALEAMAARWGLKSNNYNVVSAT